jgi:hypothetical protein
VIGHEFGHMIENRMIGKGDSRSGFHAGSMGEAFGDLNAMEYLNENGFVPTDGENRFAVGTYATGNKEHAIRDYAMNYPRTGPFPTPSVYPHVDPLNFSDIGYDTPGNEVHSDARSGSRMPVCRRSAQTASSRRRTVPATGAGSSSCTTRSYSIRRRRRCSTPGTPCSRRM